MKIDHGTLEIIIEIAVCAGDVIMPFYRDEIDIQENVKDDSSPVTLADQKAEIFIINELSKRFPDIPIVAEEMIANGDVPNINNQDVFFLVDPLDGTKEFINKRDEFTVNIALIQSNEPVMGVVYVPVLDEIYAGLKDNGAYHFKNARNKLGEIYLEGISPIRLCANKKEIKKAVASRSHMNDETKEFMKENGITEFISAGSSLKFCMVAIGDADVYPRFGRTMEWDTAAGDAVLRAAGGITVTTSGRPMVYKKQNQSHDADFANPFFIAKCAS